MRPFVESFGAGVSLATEGGDRIDFERTWEGSVGAESGREGLEEFLDEDEAGREALEVC